MINIDGKTQVYGVIGDPIEHTLSPLIHNTIAELEGSNFVYTAFHVKPDALVDAIKGAYGLGIKGLNVTVPHKKAIIRSLYTLDRTAQAAGAVNTVKYTPDGYIGYNTDMIGAKYAIEGAGCEIGGKRVLILGAGGAANACAAMVADRGARAIYISNRTKEKAEAIVKSIMACFGIKAVALSSDEIYNIPECDLVINCTTLGFGANEDKTPIEDTSFFKAKDVKLVFDAIYAPWETKLLADAKAEGVKTLNGFNMLVYQAIAAREIWSGRIYDKPFCEKVRDLVLKSYLENKK